MRSRGLSRFASRRSALALTGAALAVYLGAEAFLFPGRIAFPLDDAYIHLQLARRLAEGAGLSYQPGDGLLPASTAPLWTALLSLGFLLPGALPLVWAKLLGIATLLGTVAGTWRLGRALGLGSTACSAAAALVGTSHWLLWAALSAMEVGLFAALSTWSLALWVESAQRADPAAARVRSIAWFAAASLARPEGYLLLGMALLGLGLRETALRETALRGTATKTFRAETSEARWRHLAHCVAITAVVLVPILLFYRVTGGSFLPTTFAAKTRPALDLWPSVPLLANVLSVFLRSQPVLTLFAVGGALHLLVRGARGTALVALWPLALPMAYSMLASDGAPLPMGNFGRYYMPLLPSLVVLGVVGVVAACHLEEHPSPAARRRRTIALAIVATVVLLAQLALLFNGPIAHTRTLANVEDSDVRAARWLGERLPADAVLAVQDVGALKFLLPNTVIDLAGLVTPEVVSVLRGPESAGQAGAGAWEERLGQYLAKRRPDYLVVFSRFYPQLIRSPGFRVVERFEVPENITMAGDELVIVETPWTRYRIVEP